MPRAIFLLASTIVLDRRFLLLPDGGRVFSKDCAKVSSINPLWSGRKAHCERNGQTFFIVRYTFANDNKERGEYVKKNKLEAAKDLKYYAYVATSTLVMWITSKD